MSRFPRWGGRRRDARGRPIVPAGRDNVAGAVATGSGGGGMMGRMTPLPVIAFLVGSAAVLPAESYTAADLPRPDGRRLTVRVSPDAQTWPESGCHVTEVVARPGLFWTLYGPPLELPKVVTWTVSVIAHSDRVIGGRRFEGFTEVRITVPQGPPPRPPG
jgi:hypothetical protein